MKTRDLAALIEGGLSRTIGFRPIPENQNIAPYMQWLEHRLSVAKIPLLNTKYVMGFSPCTFIVEAGCCIATFREQCHNSGLQFARVKPLNGDNNSCWLEIDVEIEGCEEHILAFKHWESMAGAAMYFVEFNKSVFLTSPDRARAKVFISKQEAELALKQIAAAKGIKNIGQSWIKNWYAEALQRY